MTELKSTGRFTNELRLLRSTSYDECRTCGTKLLREIPAYAGYDVDGSPMYVGDCCKNRLVELASHIYWWWEFDKRIDPNTKLWRYMDLAKFLHLIDHRALYFSRADKLGDPFEGASGIADRQMIWDEFYLNFFRNSLRNPPAGYLSPPDDVVEGQAATFLGELKRTASRDRRTKFVSCWHSNAGESEALWRLYCPPGTPGVALQTTAGRLVEALGNDGSIQVGRVQYVDFQKNFAGFYDRIFWKRSSLSHESEVRAVITETGRKRAVGISKPVDLTKLCVRVVPSPFAQKWFAPLLSTLVERYGVSIRLEQSEILLQPFF